MVPLTSWITWAKGWEPGDGWVQSKQGVDLFTPFTSVNLFIIPNYINIGVCGFYFIHCIYPSVWGLCSVVMCQNIRCTSTLSFMFIWSTKLKAIGSHLQIPLLMTDIVTKQVLDLDIISKPGPALARQNSLRWHVEETRLKRKRVPFWLTPDNEIKNHYSSTAVIQHNINVKLHYIERIFSMS